MNTFWAVGYKPQDYHPQVRKYFRMYTLDEIGIRHGTDKASQFTRTYAQPHNYLIHLERFFEPLRDKPIKLLEIGVGGGESIQTWLEYFPNAHIYGIDIVSGTNPYNTPGAKAHERYAFACGDQSKSEFWKKFIEVYGGEWDVVIDDGSHDSRDIQTTFYALWKNLKSGGIYEIEDLDAAPASATWLRSFCPTLGCGDFDSIYFARELAVIRKR